MQRLMHVDQPSGPRYVSRSVTVLSRVAFTMVALAYLLVLTSTRSAQVQVEAAELHPGMMRQLKAVLAEKRSRTTAQKKIDSFLLMAMKQQRGETLYPPVGAGVEVGDDGTIVVDITCVVTNDIIETIEAMGGTILNSYPRYDKIRARMPLRQLDSLATESTVRSIRLPMPWVTRHRKVITEGDAAHRADAARTTFGVDGSGVKVCVISDGVDDLANRQEEEELPNVDILPDQAGHGSEGTAMLEIIHDLAPGAELGFATALFSPEQFATNILALHRVLNCDIIVDDVAYLGQAPFQDDIVGQAVETVVADGVVYFSAAGNDGSLSKRTSSTYEGNYVDSGVRFEDLFPDVSALTGGLHDFDLGINGLTIADQNVDEGLAGVFGSNIANQIVDEGQGIVLHWADPLGGSNNDYDLCLADEGLTGLIGCATFTQDGNDDPLEFLPFAPAGSQALILNFSTSAEPRFLHLGVFGATLEVGTTGAIFGHPGADGAIAVGAASVLQAGGGAFDGTEEAELFSSDGPRRIFFDADGEPFTPDNFSSTGGIVRDKPDITAADGVTTTTPGFETFFGTSAAAPHAAGVAALMKQADPTLTPNQVERILGNTALDIEETGFDDTTGFGLIDALNAVDAVGDADGAEVINDALSLGHLNTFFDPDDSRAPAGVFTIEITFTNTSPHSYSDVFFKVTTLTGGNQVLNAEGGPGGQGSRVSGPDQLDAGESFDAVFEIGLQEASRFRFSADAFGTTN